MTHPAYGTLRAVLPFASVLLQRNPGPMTLEGTNTWLLGAPGATVVVDPGQHEPAAHLDTLLAAAPAVSLVLLTHRHPDHSDAARAVHERTGAPVRAVDAQHCVGAAPLVDGEVLQAGGLRFEVLTTPGHTADSAAFVVGDGGTDAAAVLTGDTILGRGTTVIAEPDGDLGAYLGSLERLRGLGAVATLPGHGPDPGPVDTVAATYLAHRQERLDQIRAALAQLGPDASARQVVEVVYADVDQVLWDAAEQSVRAQLAYLRD